MPLAGSARFIHDAIKARAATGAARVVGCVAARFREQRPSETAKKPSLRKRSLSLDLVMSRDYHRIVSACPKKRGKMRDKDNRRCREINDAIRHVLNLPLPPWWIKKMARYQFADVDTDDLTLIEY